MAGGARKVGYLRDEIGLDAVVDYQASDDLRAALGEACPDGIDVYFDNVGGEITQAALSLINRHARIVVCGQTSQYNAAKDSGKFAPELLIERSARMEGFVVYDYEDRNDEAIARLGQLVRQGKLRYREHIVDGLENAPRAFVDLFESNNCGRDVFADNLPELLGRVRCQDDLDLPVGHVAQSCSFVHVADVARRRASVHARCTRLGRRQWRLSGDPLHGN